MKNILCEYLSSQAEWRRAKAEEYPDDTERNLRAAGTLSALAAHVSELGDEDPRLQALAEAGEWLGRPDGIFSPHPEVAAEIGRYGFNDPADDMDALLDALVQRSLLGVMRSYEDTGLYDSDDEDDG